MTTETYTVPSKAEIERIVADAHVARAEFLASAVRAAAHWIAHPSFRGQHA